MSEEFGWVIEKAESEISAPLYWCGPVMSTSFGHVASLWLKDNLQAIRFARKLDAERISSMLLNTDPDKRQHRVAEHGWGP